MANAVRSAAAHVADVRHSDGTEPSAVGRDRRSAPAVDGRGADSSGRR
ncbi:hypothetical protein [Gordonia soli]|nr:hypothetical protein [Gordonia soli]